MAEIKFYANIKGATTSELINHTSGSGIGFYGANFGVSVPIGTRQSTTFETDALGVESGRQLNNTRAVELGDQENVGTVSINGASAVELDKLPNYLCPLNIRFTHTEPVVVQNCKLRIFDRQDITKHASGVVTYIYEARHPSDQQSVSNGSQRARTENTWYEFDPGESMSDMPITQSPGVSGLNTNAQDSVVPVLGFQSYQGLNHSSNRHDWYIAISSEPETVGSKTRYGLYFSLEYL